MFDLVAAATLLFRDRFSAGISAAAREMDRATERMSDDAERMARTTSRAAERAGRATGGLAHDTREAGRDTGRATRTIGTAWRALDVLDDISGVAGAVWDLTAGMREAVVEAIAMSREVELAMARIDSIEAAATPDAAAAEGATSEAVLAHARMFATGRGGVLSEMVGLREVDFIATAKEALSAGFEESAALALTRYSAGLGAAAEGTMDDAARMLRPMYALLADPAADAEAEVARFADQVAGTQALYDIPSLPPLTEAITTAAPLAGQHGIPSEVLLAALGTFHTAGTPGSEGGEAFNSILEEITSGMEELGLAKVETAAGAMDFPATVARLREHRVQSGLSDTAWTDHMMDVFNELGGRHLANLTSELNYQRFTGGLPEIAASAGVMQRRLAAVADTREMQRARIDAMKASNKRVNAELMFGPLDRAWLDVREWWQGHRAENIDTRMWLETGTQPSYLAGRAIPETLAEGVEQGGPALGAALDSTLQREVDDRLPHSDARRGPLARLTASGRALPETLAAGVVQGAGALQAAVTAAVPALPASFKPPDAPVLPPLVADSYATDLEPPALPTLPPLAADSYAADLEPPALPTLPPLAADSYAADLEPPMLPTLPPLAADSYAADLEPPALPTLPPLAADSYAADLEPPALPTLPPLAADSYAADLEPPMLPTLPPLVADSYAADLEPPMLPTLPPLVADSFAVDLEPPAAPVLPPLVADSYAADLEPPAAPVLPPLVADSYAADLEPPAAPALPPLAADSFAVDLEPPAAPVLPPLAADSYAADLEPPAAPVLPPLAANSYAADLEPPALPTLPPLAADSYAADLEPPAAPVLPSLAADSYAADLEPPALPTLPPLAAARPTSPPFLPQSPVPSELLAAVRDLTREIRRLRTENGAGVTIERVELHADDTDLLRVAEGLAALRGGP